MFRRAKDVTKYRCSTVPCPHWDDTFLVVEVKHCKMSR